MTTHRFDVPEDLRVELKLPVGSAQLVAGPTGTATVELTASSAGGEELIAASRVEMVHDRLLVHVPERGMRGLGILRPRFSASVHARITIPEGVRLDADVAAADLDAELALGTVEIRSASGDLRLGDVAGSASVHTASGDLELGDVAGGLTAATASGHMHVGEIGGTASLRTASGDLVVGCLAHDARLRSVSGDVSVREVRGGDVDVASTSGDVDLRVAPGLQIHLDVSSVSGALISDLGDGSGDDRPVDLSLRARSVSGDIAIRRGRRAGVRAEVV